MNCRARTIGAVALILLMSPAARADQAAEYDGHQWVTPHLEWPDAAAPVRARAILRVIDQRGSLFEKDPRLVGQDGGVGFNPATVVSEELDAVRLHRLTLQDIAVHSVVAAAGPLGIALSHDLPGEAPVLELALTEFWCSEPGDDDQWCSMTGALVLRSPEAGRRLWQDRVEVGWREGPSSDRDQSYSDLILTFSKACRGALARGRVNERAEPWLAGIDAALVELATPPPDQRPVSWLSLRDEDGAERTPHPYGAPLFGHLPRHEPSRELFLVVDRTNTRLNLEEASAILGSERLASSANEALATFEDKIRKGRGLGVVGLVFAGTAAASLGVGLGSMSAQRAQERDGVAVSDFDRGGARILLGVGIGSLAVAIPVGSAGGGLVDSGQTHAARLRAGDLRRVLTEDDLHELVGRYNRKLLGRD